MLSRSNTTFFILIISIALLASCNNQEQSTDSIPNINFDIQPTTSIQKRFRIDMSCQVNAIDFVDKNADLTFFVNRKDSSIIDSVLISGQQDDIIINNYINIFNGVGDYPFKNNDADQGIGRGELIQTSEGTKFFFSVDGQVAFSVCDLNSGSFSGTFSGSYFFKGERMPETFDVENGIFEILATDTSPQ